jgi:hypothetical protein
MEEILASIRRIISEDETPATPEGETAAAPVEAEADEEAEPELAAETEVEAEPEHHPEPEMLAEPAHEPEVEHLAEEEEDVLELTEPVVSASSNESIGDLDVLSSDLKAEPAPMPAATQPIHEDEPLVSAPAAAAAVSAFGQLASRVGMPPASQTLDDVVRELLRPLLKEWLDVNLAGIVQAKVEEEVERLARRRGS